MILSRYFVLLCLLFGYIPVHAFELKLQKVTEQVYALIGEIGPRSKNNHAMNNTMGFVVTQQGVILVSSGATPRGAQLIEKTITTITRQPIRWVINIGVQDHHWLGNSYFANKGAEIIALAHTVKGQQNHLFDHLRRLEKIIPNEAKEVKATYAAKPIESDTAELNLGGIDMQLIWTKGGHFTEDAYLWLPQQKIVFSGDLVFHNRMLGIQSHTPVLALQKAFHNMAALKPEYIIPGHGYAGSLALAHRDTGDYIDWLVKNVKQAQEDWKDISETTDLLQNISTFKHLKFYDGWHRRNINRVYLYLESAQ
ncbi:MAG: MBL fold metallo-hydrolase [Pseudomonadota bacterium]